MTSSQPTQPLTDEELEAYAALVEVEIPGTWSRSERNALIAHYITAARRLLAEVSRLRSELAEMETDRDKYQDWYDAAVDDLREVHLSRVEADPVHFAPYGGSFTTCGQALSGITPWSAARSDFSSPTLTTRPEKATCAECIAALGLDQDGRGQ